MEAKLEIVNTLTLPETISKTKGHSQKSFKTCPGCHKFSCICGELTVSPCFRLRKRITPNNLRREITISEKRKQIPGLGYVVTPAHQHTNSFYCAYTSSKKRLSEVQPSQANIFKNNSSVLLKNKFSNKDFSFSPNIRRKFENDNKLFEKIVNIGKRYIKDDVCRYQRKRLIELFYNILRKGKKGDYACSTLKKIEEIAGFLVRHSKELGTDHFFSAEVSDDNQSALRFEDLIKHCVGQ
jgi:hypothetical protein